MKKLVVLSMIAPAVLGLAACNTKAPISNDTTANVAGVDENTIDTANITDENVTDVNATSGNVTK